MNYFIIIKEIKLVKVLELIKYVQLNFQLKVKQFDHLTKLVQEHEKINLFLIK